MSLAIRTGLQLIVMTIILTAAHISLAATMQIDPTKSIVHTTNWSNWQWNLMGLPDDNVDITISGNFDLSVKPGVINIFTNYQSPDRIQFTNIDVPTNGPDGRAWELPSFEGFFDQFSTSSFAGSEDPCFSFSYYFNGSCYSAGDFGSYTGNYDGVNFVFTGVKNPNFSTGANGFFYTIVATPVPIQTSIWLFGSGLLGLIGVARRKKAA